MTTPRQYVEDFAKVWELGFPADMGLSESRPGSAGIRYGGSVDHLVRRSKGGFMTLARAKFQQILDGAYVTDPCKGFLVKHVDMMQFFGTPPQILLPLDMLGIDLPKDEYGPFDPNADLRSIEGKLLEFSEGAAFNPEMVEVNQRWRTAYVEKYR